MRGSFSLWLNLTFFRLSTMSVTSSRTCSMVENSCQTLSIRMREMATPSSERSRMRRRALPSVVPYPCSSGSAT